MGKVFKNRSKGKYHRAIEIRGKPIYEKVERKWGLRERKTERMMERNRFF